MSEDLDQFNLEEYRAKLKDRKTPEEVIPAIIYMDVEPRCASAVITLPNLQVMLPERPKPSSDNSSLVLMYDNNGKFKLDPRNPSQLDIKDWDARMTLQQVNWDGESIQGEELLRRRKELLERFFEKRLEGKKNVKIARTIMEGSGLAEGSYLYRAIARSEYTKMLQTGCKLVNDLDPSDNFENETMYGGEGSQVKKYVAQQDDKDSSDDPYSGYIIRWKIEHPLLYRVVGGAKQRVVPACPHYLPPQLEISDDRGVTYKSFKPTEPSSSLA